MKVNEENDFFLAKTWEFDYLEEEERMWSFRQSDAQPRARRLKYRKFWLN